MDINPQTLAYAQSILGNRISYYMGYLAGSCPISKLMTDIRNTINSKTRNLGRFRYFWILTDKGLAFAISGDAASVAAAKQYLNTSERFDCATAYEGKHGRLMGKALVKAVETHVTLPTKRTFGGSQVPKDSE